MARKLADSTVARIREGMLQRKKEIIDKVDEREKEIEDALHDEAAAERVPDPTTAEGGTLSYEYELLRQIDAAALAEVHKIDDALAKMKGGTYGLCETCGESIPMERLKALPHSTQCVSCASGSRT
jgi:DnaK suppressor protein